MYDDETQSLAAQVPRVTEPTAEQRNRAARAVTNYIADPVERAEILAMLDLTPDTAYAHH